MAAHWFSTNDTQKLLANKKVVIIGDSVERSVYKDLVCLLKANQLLKEEDLKKKGEDSFEGDQLLEGGNKAGLKSVNYKEVRKFPQGSLVVTFYFVARCYGEYMKSILATFETEPPDVIIMNSCLWDLCRYGKNAHAEFKSNIDELLEAIGLVMPYDSKRVFIWTATLPVIDSQQELCLPFPVPQDLRPENKNVRNANLYVRDRMADYGEHFMFLDLYEIFHAHLNHRIHDGIHWDSFAHRKITHLLLTRIAVRWNFKLPSKENGPPVPPINQRRTIRPSLASVPTIGGRRSLGFVPNHSRLPYEKPCPRPIQPDDHSLYSSEPALVRYFQRNLARPLRYPRGPRQGPVRPGPSIRFPSRNSPIRPFQRSPESFVFRAGQWRTNPQARPNRPLPFPRINRLDNNIFLPFVRKLIWEDQACSPSTNEYRPRRFLV